MIPRLLAALAALAAFLSVITHLHLTVRSAGLTVTVYVPWVLLGGTALTLAVLTWLFVRHLRNFRSSPHLRTVANWST